MATSDNDTVRQRDKSAQLQLALRTRAIMMVNNHAAVLYTLYAMNSMERSERRMVFMTENETKTKVSGRWYILCIPESQLHDSLPQLLRSMPQSNEPYVAVEQCISYVSQPLLMLVNLPIIDPLLRPLRPHVPDDAKYKLLFEGKDVTPYLRHVTFGATTITTTTTTTGDPSPTTLSSNNSSSSSSSNRIDQKNTTIANPKKKKNKKKKKKKTTTTMRAKKEKEIRHAYQIVVYTRGNKRDAICVEKGTCVNIEDLKEIVRNKPVLHGAYKCCGWQKCRKKCSTVHNTFGMEAFSLENGPVTYQVSRYPMCSDTCETFRPPDVRPLLSVDLCGSCDLRLLSAKGECLFLCEDCRNVRYCNQTCQRRAWPTHKLACCREPPPPSSSSSSPTQKETTSIPDDIVSSLRFDDVFTLSELPDSLPPSSCSSSSPTWSAVDDID